MNGMFYYWVDILGMRLLSLRNSSILAITFFIFIAGAFWLRSIIMKRTDIVPAELGRVHYYNNPAVSLNNIAVKIFYVLPAHAENALAEDWQPILEESFKKISRFHSVQFLGKSAVTYDIFPRPVFLPKSRNAYDAPEVLVVNLAGLAAIEEDVFKVLKLESEDELKKFLKTSPNQYPVLFFVYQGRGMGGNRGRAYIPASILDEVAFKDALESIMYHNIGYALGFKDDGAVTDLRAASDGIMGTGLLRPLQINFIEPNILQKMGLLEAKY
ncbi:MAG: hypothetical protein HYT12_02590 [Candidatus Liptonbacteria bacterium]|nr:hypothetical protein [Candidatus Liptonbacteria bacterium]